MFLQIISWCLQIIRVDITSRLLSLSKLKAFLTSLWVNLCSIPVQGQLYRMIPCLLVTSV